MEDPGAGYRAAGSGPERPTTEMPGGPGAGAYGGAGYQQPETPPITAFALRHRLIRPTAGRKISGVCAGLGRGTNTDPTFWRVILAVLTVFGGIGLLGYAVCWVVMPSDGDEVAPIESIFGRGRSATPTPLTVLLSLAALILALIVLNSGLKFTLLVALVVTVVAVLLTRRSQQGGTPEPEAPTGRPPGTGFATAPAGPPPAAGYESTGYQAGYQSTGYQAPFAPHGPYHRQSWGAAPPAAASEARPATAAPIGTGEIPVTGWEQTGSMPPPPPPPVRAQPKPPRERSILGRITLVACCLSIAVLVLLSAAGVSVPADAYIGVTLAVVGAGLVVGAWRGRARWLIALGCVLMVALPIAWVGERVTMGGPHGPYSGESRTWTPRSLADLPSSYHTGVGDATLNLSKVDFDGAHRTVSVNVNVGDVHVILPSTVDTTVRLHGGVGDATLFGERENGPRPYVTRTDLGPDGKGGGELTLNLTANVGDVEVTR